MAISTSDRLHSKTPSKVPGRKGFFKRWKRWWSATTGRVACYLRKTHVHEPVKEFMEIVKAPKTIFIGLLALILSVATLLRLVGLESAFQGLTTEEVIYAVQSQMLIHTGKDLSGRWLPLFPSEDFSTFWGIPNTVCQPLFLYLKILLSLLLGSDAVAVRLPSVLWGIVSLASTAVLSWMLFWQARLSVRHIVTASTAFLICISPCHHLMSRLAIPNIMSSVFLTIGITLLLRGVARIANKGTRPTEKELDRELQLCLSCGTTVLALTAYTHSGMILFSVLLFTTFFMVFRSQTRGTVLRHSLLMMLVLLPAIWQIFQVTFFSQGNLLHSSTASDSASQHPGIMRFMTPFWLSQLQLLCCSWPSYIRQLVILSAEAPLLILGIGWLAWQSFWERSGDTYSISSGRLLLVWLLAWPLTNNNSSVHGWAAVPIAQLVAGYGIGRSVQWLFKRNDTRQKISSKPEHQGLSERSIPDAMAFLIFGGLACWLLYDATAYYGQLGKSPDTLPQTAVGEITHQAFVDLQQRGFFNKSRVLLTEDVGRSYPFILYTENLTMSMDQIAAERSRDLNSVLRSAGTPYEIVFTHAAHTYTINESDLLLISSRGLQRYPPHLSNRLKLLQTWPGGLLALELAHDDECIDCDDDII